MARPELALPSLLALAATVACGTNEESTPMAAAVEPASGADTARPAEPVDDGIVFVATSDHDVCVRFSDGSFSCVSVAHTGELSPLATGPIVPDAVALSIPPCFAEGANVKCSSLHDPHGRARELTFPFPPVELFGLPRPLRSSRSQELCGRSAAGEVLCITASDESATRRIFERSTAIGVNTNAVFSLRDDGKLECLGDGSCAAMHAAMHPMSGPGGGGVTEGVRATPSTPVDAFTALRSSWPSELELMERPPGTVSRQPIVVPLGPFASLVSGTPCAFETDGSVLCWEWLAAPWRVPRVPPGTDHFTLGNQLCARSDAEVRCVHQEEEGAPIVIAVPNLARAFRVGSSLCTLDHERELACRKWGELEAEPSRITL